MITAEEYECRPANEFAKSAQDFFCTSPTSPDTWAAIGACAGAIFALFAVILAWRVHVNDQRRHRLQQIRQATAELIASANDLIFKSDDLSRDNLADRSQLYQKSIMLEFAALERLDAVRFNAAINWMLKASGLRRFNAAVMTRNGEMIPTHSAFLPRLVYEFTQSLRTYDFRGGKFDLVQDIANRFDKVYSEPQFIRDHDIQQTLISQEKNYLDLLLSRK